MRLDHYLHQHRYTTSRNKAKELILAGKVRVDGDTIRKPAFAIEGDEAAIEIGEDAHYVGRAALKLKGFLKSSGLAVSGRRCLDIGSSTGGFVQVLLEAGAAAVTGVDVGSGQLHPSLREDDRVISVEETDIRDFFPDRRFDLITCDVSFVGIAHILPDIDRLAKRDIVLLFKPQFEVGREARRTRRGVVTERHAIAAAEARFLAETRKYGWEPVDRQASELKGKAGNVEIFFHFQKR